MHMREYTQMFQERLRYVPFDVTISFNLTMLGLFSALRILTSRIAVIGNPFSSCSVLMRLSATISPVSLSAPTKTLLQCFCRIMNLFEFINSLNF